MSEQKTDDERIAELQLQAEFLDSEMRKETDRSSIAKLANAIVQTHHIRTGVEHLKLQRLKVATPEQPRSEAEVLAELVKWLEGKGMVVVKGAQSMPDRPKPKAVPT